MEDAIKQALICAGCDVNATLERFMNNEALFFKFLKKFIEDKNYALLVESIAESKTEDAERYAHTLKGVSANLGFSGFADSLNQLVIELRANTPVSVLTPILGEITSSYEKICILIKKL